MPSDKSHGIRRPLRAVGSLWFAAALLVLLPAAMACATVFESAHGPKQTLAVFYRSWWFETLLVLLAVNVVAAVVVRFPISRKQIGFVVTHASILITCAGALVTKFVGLDGQVGIVEGQTASEFAIGRDTLTVAPRGDNAPRPLDLAPVIGHGYRSLMIEDPPVLTVGEARLEVVRYLPDSRWRRLVTNDNPRPHAAIEVVETGDELAESVLVSDGQTARFGATNLAYRRIADAQELARLRDADALASPSAIRTVRIEYENETYELALEDCMKKPVRLGETEFTIRVLRFLPHATVQAGGGISSASDRPQNPFIEVEINGPAGIEIRRAFAKFPDFDMSQGEKKTPELKVTFIYQASDRPAAPIEVLSGPNDELFVRFARGADPIATEPLRVGAPVKSPWPGFSFTVLREYENARIEWSLEPVESVRESNAPAILVRITEQGRTEERWIQRNVPASLIIGGTPHDILFGDKSVPLGFDVTLERFQIGYYPGTERPRSFESEVTITGPGASESKTHLISMNRPVTHGGFTLYQSSYRQDRGRTASYLSVSRDPGQPIVFAGYFAMMGGMIIVFATRLLENRRRQARAAVTLNGSQSADRPG